MHRFFVLPMTITSDPPGPAVSGDGIVAGVTPLEKDCPGSYFQTAAQGCAPADTPTTTGKSKEKGDTSNEARKGTFLRSFDTIASNDCRCHFPVLASASSASLWAAQCRRAHRVLLVLRPAPAGPRYNRTRSPPQLHLRSSANEGLSPDVIYESASFDSASAETSQRKKETP
jgi:hypothetical protein